MRLWTLTLGLVALGCTGNGALGSTCSTDGDCAGAGADGGLFCASRCLDARGDFDFDGVRNGEERALGTDPLTSDSDSDGRPDALELESNDTDGDGRRDVLESSRADEDADCIPDQADPRDAGFEQNEINLRRQCRFLGACLNTFPRQRATCVGGVLTCTLDGAPYPAETCNELDDDCDGVIDEGCADAGVSAGPFLDPEVRQAADVPGTLVIERPVKLVVPDGLPVSPKTLELDWVSDFEARCVPREDEAPPLLVMEIVTVGAVITDFELLGDGPPLQRAARDARGRRASLIAYGRVSGAVALEHLAGTWQALSVRCIDSTRFGKDLSLIIPVFIKKTGNSGETLPPLTKTTGCSASGLGVLGPLALVWFLRRRRRLVAPLAALLLTACPATESTSTLASGHGATNTQPLWPLGGEQMFPWGNVELERDSTLPFGTALHSQRRVAGGVEHRFDRGFNPAMPGLAVRLDDSGDLYLTATHYGPLEPAVLLVPKQVKVGQSWEATLPFERDTLDHFIQLPLEWGDGRFRFTVSHRQEVHTRWGRRTLWRIEWVGPPIPHGLTPSGAVSTARATLEVPEAEQARLRGYFDFVEGAGPVSLAPFLRGLDALQHYGYSNATQGWEEPVLSVLSSAGPSLSGRRDGASALAELVFPPVADGALELAASTPQEAPTLTSTPVSGEPLTESGLMPKFAWLTRSSKEPAGDLVLVGDTAPFSAVIDPNGNTTGVFFPTLTVACARIGDDGRLAGTPPVDCPDRIRNAARPYVGPDGARWDTLSIGKVLAGRTSNVSPSGFEPFAPFWKDGGFESVGRTVTVAGSSPLQVRTFNTVPTAPLIYEPTAPAPIPGTTRFELSEVVNTAADLSFAVPFGGVLAYLQVGPLTRLSSIRPDEEFGTALWVDWSGQVQRRMHLVGSRYGWTHVDDTHRLTEVGQLGELRVLHLDENRLWAELLGRVTLPPNHVAGSALWLGGDRYLVLSQEAPEFRYTGLTSTYASVHHLTQKAPAAGRIFAHVVTAPSTGLIDRDWSLRHVSASIEMGNVRACVPAGSGLTIDGLRIGSRTLAPSEVTVSGDCATGLPTADDEARTKGVTWTPLAVHLAGQGWVLRPLPPLRRDMMKRSRVVATSAAAPTRGPEQALASTLEVPEVARVGDAAPRREAFELGFRTDALWMGGRSTCARDEFTRELWCWAENMPPRRVEGWAEAQSLAVSGDRACGVRLDGTFACFDTSTFVTRTFDAVVSAQRVWGAPEATEREGRFVIEQQGQWFGLGALQATRALGGPWRGPWLTPQRLSQVEGAREVVMGKTEVCFQFDAGRRCAADGTGWTRLRPLTTQRTSADSLSKQGAR